MYEQIIKQKDGSSLGVPIQTWTIIDTQNNSSTYTLCTKFAHVKKLFDTLCKVYKIPDEIQYYDKKLPLKWWVVDSYVGEYKIKYDIYQIKICKNLYYQDYLKELESSC